jgi:hypothetical protein
MKLMARQLVMMFCILESPMFSAFLSPMCGHVQPLSSGTLLLPPSEQYSKALADKVFSEVPYSCEGALQLIQFSEAF